MNICLYNNIEIFINIIHKVCNREENQALNFWLAAEWTLKVLTSHKDTRQSDSRGNNKGVR